MTRLIKWRAGCTVINQETHDDVQTRGLNSGASTGIGAVYADRFAQRGGDLASPAGAGSHGNGKAIGPLTPRNRRRQSSRSAGCSDGNPNPARPFTGRPRRSFSFGARAFMPNSAPSAYTCTRCCRRDRADGNLGARRSESRRVPRRKGSWRTGGRRAGFDRDGRTMIRPLQAPIS